MSNENTKTFKDLKEFLETLSEDQLNQELVVEVVDSSTYRNVYFGVVQDDLYMYNDDPEDVGTLKELKDIYEEDFIADECTLVTYKGSVYIGCDN